MKWTDFAIYTIGSAIMLLVQLLAYEQLAHNKPKITINKALACLIPGLIIAYNSYINVNALRAYISFGIHIKKNNSIWNNKLYICSNIRNNIRCFFTCFKNY